MALSSDLLIQTYVTINVMIAVTVSVRMKVTADAIATAAPVDNPESPVNINKPHVILGLLYLTDQWITDRQITCLICNFLHGQV